jgi:uncharacterized repeat protein (TIGR01451 family)
LLAGFLGALVGPFDSRAESPQGCTGSALGIDLFTDVGDVHIGETIHYSATVFNGLAGSPRVACDASGIRAGIVTPDGRTNLLTLRRTALVNGQSDFYTNVVSYVVRAQDVQPDGTVRATAFDNGDIHQNQTLSRGGSFQGVNTQVNQPCLQITAQCVGSVGESGLITFTGLVTNCGNTTLVGVTITNIVNGVSSTVLFPTTLARGQVAPFSGSWVPSNPCIPSTATLFVRGSDEFTTHPRTLTNSVGITCRNVLTPRIAVTQDCPAAPASVGGVLTYTGTVSNIGDVTLTNVVVLNERTGNTPVFTVATLAPGANAGFTGSFSVPSGGDCSVSSGLTANGQDQCSGRLVSAVATSLCPLVTAPAVEVTQMCPVAPTPQGGLLNFSGTVRNAGNVTLTNIVVVSNRPVPNTVVFTASLLAPGATEKFTGSYTVPANCCSVSGMIAAGGRDVCTGVIVTDTATATCPVLTSPKIVVTKVCPAKGLEPGDLMKFSGSVANTGDITLVDVVVLNDAFGNGSPLLGPITLVPGESVSYAGSYIIPGDFCGTDTVTARGFDACTDALVSHSATTTCPVTTAPRIAVTQTCPPEPTPHNGVFAYTGTVTNPGNVTLTNVFVFNNNPAPNTPVLGPITLAPGASVNFSGSYPAPEICCSLTDTLTARGQDRCSGIAVTATTSTLCPLLYTARITVTPICPPQPVSMGDRFVFSGSVGNTGDTILTNVFVFGSHSGNPTPLLGPIVLAPGESMEYAGSFIVPSDACSVVVTATGKDTCIGNTVLDTAACPVINNPGIAVTQNCPATPVSPGGLVVYNGTVRNTGNITLRDIVVTNDRTGSAPVFRVESLAPGASASFTGSYTASLNCAVDSSATARANTLCGLAVENTVRSTCPTVTSPSVRITAICSPNSVGPGGLLTFSGTVTNIGNSPLTNVVVLNDRPDFDTVVFVLKDAVLAPGAGTTFSGSYIVPLNVCTITSVLTATGRDVCTGNAVLNSVAVTCPVTSISGIAITQNCPVNPVSPGGLLTYNGSVRNEGNIALENIVVTNDRSGSLPVFRLATLAPGASANFTGSYTAPESGNSTSISTVRARSACNVDVVNTASSACPILTSPGIAITKACPPQPVSAGGILVFSGTVTNTGNITLTNVFVMNNQPVANTPVLGPITLAPGAGMDFADSYIVPLDACAVTDTLIATGNDMSNGVIVRSSVSATCPILTIPSIAITQNCPPNPGSPGGLLRYTGSIRNAGNVTLNNITVSNDRSGAAPILTVATLAPGSSANFTGTYTAPAMGDATSTSTVRATGICGVTVTNSASSTCPILTLPGIAITKACPPQPVAAGGKLFFSGSVTNTGNITLTNVFVVNNQPAANTPVLGPITLAPGAGMDFAASYIVPLDACAVTDTLIATGNDMSNGSAITSTVSATCPILTIPSIAITQNCPPNPASPSGLVAYSGSIRNAGSITLNNVVVTNNRGGAGPILTIATLAPGASAVFTGSYLAPAIGDATSTSIVRATGLCGLSVTNSASSTCPIVTSAGIAITKACPPQPVTAGGTLIFSGSVTNTGNITLTNVFVVNNQPAANTPVLGPITLAPGVGAIFTGSYPVANGACAITDTLTATGVNANTGVAIASTVSATCPIITIPSIAITMNCPPIPANPSGLLTYSGSIRNAGTISLNNIVVTNDRSGATPILTVATLAPGASANFTGSYTAPAIGDATSTSTVRATSLCGVEVSNSASSTCPISTSAGIAITKACPPLPVTAGGILSFSGTVTNTGNITLTNVFVVNNKPVANTPVLGPITLAPGAGTGFTGSYTVPLDACATSDTLVATGINANTGVAVTSTVSATCPILTIPSISITQNCPPNPVSPGGLLTYTGSIRNAGTITLNNIVVTNDRGGATPILAIATLAPGASANFTGSYIAPAIGDATSTSIVRATGLCGLSVTNSASSTCPIVTSAGIAITKACPPLPVTAGGVLVFSGTVTNTGNITLTNVFVINDRPAANTPVLGPITLAPGVGTGFSGSYTVALDACATTDTLIATGINANTDIAITSTVSATCPILTIPSIAITQNCPPGPVSPSGLLTYSGSIRNAGTITLNNIVVTNDRSGAAPILTVATLAAGASANFTGSYIAPAIGDATSTSTVRAASLCGIAVTNSASSTCPILTAAGIAITKACPPLPVSAGGILSFSGTVTNTGNITLTNVFVVNNKPVPNTPVLGPITLAPGMGTGFTGSYTVALDACATTGTLIATGINANTGIAITSTVSATCPILTIPSIAITQNCPLGPVGPSGLLTYSGSIRNAGTIPLNNIVVTNDRSGGAPILTVATLAAGASASFTGSYIAPAMGDATSTSTVRATSLCGIGVTNSASSTCPILTAAGIAITKACPPLPVSPGGMLVFTGSITNSGNVTLTNVFVVNSQPAPNTPVLGPLTLAPGSGTTFTSSYLVPLDACGTTDTLIASGVNSVTGAAVTSSISPTCLVTTSATIAMTQNCPPSLVSPGALLTYDGSIRNAGNITLTNIVVTDNRSGAVPLLTVASMVPGAFATFTGSFMAPSSGDYTIISSVRATSICGVTVTNTASLNCPLILTAPGIAVTLVCPVVPAASGALITYTGTVGNPGNITLTNVVVLSDQPAPSTVVFTVPSLAPGGSTDFSATFNSAANACSVTGTVTARGTPISAATAVTNSATMTCPVVTTPGIAITENCPVPVGGVATFSGVVSNTGNITLTNVLVVGSQPNSNTPVLGPITLAPGATMPFSGSYPVAASTGPATFETLNPATGLVTSRFVVGTNFNGVIFADQDKGYGATQFYSIRRDTAGNTTFFNTINANGTITDRFNTGDRNFDSLTFAAPDVGYGSTLFYYLRHDSAGVSSFGSITPGGVVGVVADHKVLGTNYVALAFSATDVGYGANLFYYIRRDATGLSTFGTIDPAPGGPVTDRFTVGSNLDGLFFTSTDVGYGANLFYYVRHDAAGLSTFGTINPVTQAVVDRFVVGNDVTDLAFTTTDTGFGSNQFYLLRRPSPVPPGNILTATGIDACQARTVTATANCSGLGILSILPGNGSNNLSRVFRQSFTGSSADTQYVESAAELALDSNHTGQSFMMTISAANGMVTVSWPATPGVIYTLQSANSTTDPVWIDIAGNVTANDATASKEDPIEPGRERFYRVMVLRE